MDTKNTNTLTADKQTEADRIEEILKGAASVEIRRMAELLASKENGELFGETEFSRARDNARRDSKSPLPRGKSDIGIW